ncbi:hypothetical protein [Delftia lacustris]|uniref:hypothetical protein n=1 Tax=Delftia lacustris TaxID=558537 RepID=UPI003B96E6D8
MALRQREPIAPVPGTHAARADGGWRSVPAETTVQRLSRHVSPLTGVIARVTPLTAETDEALTVYRSEIFRTPAPGSGFLAAPDTAVPGQGPVGHAGPRQRHVRSRGALRRLPPGR